MNSNTAALQTGHHHHHHQPTSSASANSLASQQYHQQQQQSQQQHQQQPKPVNPNPSVHRYNVLNDPWLLQSQVQQQQGPTPPLRQHKRPAPNPPPAGPVVLSTSNTQLNALTQKPNVQHLSSVNSTYNQPLHFTSSSAQTQTTPGLAAPSQNHQQHSPKSPNQNFLHSASAGAGNLMSTSLNSASTTASSMVNNHTQSSTLHHTTTAAGLLTTSTSLSNNNNNNNNFDDLNLHNGSSSSIGGASSTSAAAAAHQKKLEMKLNTMP